MENTLWLALFLIYSLLVWIICLPALINQITIPDHTTRKNMYACLRYTLAPFTFSIFLLSKLIFYLTVLLIAFFFLVIFIAFIMPVLFLLALFQSEFPLLEWLLRLGNFIMDALFKLPKEINLFFQQRINSLERFAQN